MLLYNPSTFKAALQVLIVLGEMEYGNRSLRYDKNNNNLIIIINNNKFDLYYFYDSFVKRKNITAISLQEFVVDCSG